DGVVCEFQTKIVFEDAENRYEAIQAFCRKLSEKYAKKGEHPAQAAQMREKKAAAPSARELAGYECRLDSLPLACAVQDGSLLSFDLTKTASTVILYDDIHMRAKDWVLSAIRRAYPDPILLEDTAKTEQNVAAIDGIWAEMRRRGAAGQESMKRGEPVPDFERLVVHVRHPSKITPTLPDVQRVQLVAMIQTLSPAYHITFVIEENVSEMNVMLSGICLKTAVPFSQGIVLTTDISAYLAFADEVEFSGRAAAPRGFLVQDGQATLGEMIER
ncbi:MAG: hypothetical protein LUG65_07775, partial [Clostridiales bacterium]|nr:hypothetical protein [Clostridiales bacterium]